MLFYFMENVLFHFIVCLKNVLKYPFKPQRINLARRNAKKASRF